VRPRTQGLTRVLKTRRGFTLIELLVVIAIIAILAGILYPVFTKAKLQAYQTTCQSSLKQLGSAFQIYTQDYDETFPPVYLDPQTRVIPASTLVDNPQGKGYSWTEHIYPYVKNEELFKCKADPAPAQRTAVNARYLNSYAYNPLFGTRPDPVDPRRLAEGALSFAQLGNASQVAVLWDTPVDPTQRSVAQSKNNLSRSILDRTRAYEYLYMTNSGRKATYAEEGTFTVAVDAPYQWMKPRHNDASVVLFADGHVKLIKDPASGAHNDAEVKDRLNRFFDPYYGGS
jgi:prepilin-type N-terminal cleavage/methylation domain-containing protein/prepilin-type processing-associated H-X9-DG protein